MIQILGLRTFVGKEGKQVTYDKQFDPGIEVESVKDLLENYEKILEKIPTSEHWNLFYTIANCTDKKRDFKSVSAIAFDIDKIVCEYEENYIVVVCAALSVNRQDIGIVRSGNGLHFLIGLDEEIYDKSFYKEYKAHHTGLCNKIKNALTQAGLPGEVDTVVFEPRRILRLPGTVNRKPDKPEKKCVLIKPIDRTIRFVLSEHSGVPIISKDDHVNKAAMKQYSKTDPKAVLGECGFLKHCHANPNSIDEPAWYAALSITARLDGQGSTGWERSHELSGGHAGYSRDDTDQKISQALEASGPRTCESIQKLWGKCIECTHWGKVTSPILIHGDGHIPTEGTGFHHIIVSKSGTVKYIPCYEDLIKYFRREMKFKVLADTRIVYVWDGTHYQVMENASLDAYAREKFVPTPDMKVCKEFRERVRIAGIVPMPWWDESPNRKMNFKNGYLDIDTMEFKPHDPTIAFRNVLPYEYNPAAKAPVFQKMIRLVTGGDEDTIKVLLEFIGYCLSNDSCWAQRALLLTGGGSNGKSTFVEALKLLIGRGNYGVVPMDKVNDQYNLATLDGKIMNISEEATVEAFKRNDTFKNLVTGGSFIVRMIYKEPYEMTNRAKMILTCNELPETTDQNHGFYRRLIIVPFSQVIETTHPDYDPHIIQKLESELSGIFNLAMWGYKRLVSQRVFTDAKRLQEELEQYRMDNDTVLNWFTEHVKVAGELNDDFVAMNDLYESYREFMKSQGRIPEHAGKFGKNLKKLRAAVWLGITYEERHTRKYINVQGQTVRVRGLGGVTLEPVR